MNSGVGGVCVKASGRQLAPASRKGAKGKAVSPAGRGQEVRVTAADGVWAGGMGVLVSVV